MAQMRDRAAANAQRAIRDRVAVIGVGTTRQGLHPGRSQYHLGVEAFQGALADAGLEKAEVDGVLGCNYRGEGIDPIELSRLLGIDPRVTGDLDYGTGGFTTHYAAFLIASGACQTVACVYARNPHGAMASFAGLGTVYDGDHGLVKAASAAALGWARHKAIYGDPDESLGEVALAARAWAQLNPIAAWRDPLTMDQYLNQSFVIWPFRELDMCKITAGGVALIFSTTQRASAAAKSPVLLHGIARRQSPSPLESDDHFMCGPMVDVARQLRDATGLRPSEIDALFVGDASTSTVLQTLENYGFCGIGEGSDLVSGGAIAPGGNLPVNTNGGQLSEGYLISWLHHAELVRQLRGECGPRQITAAATAQFCSTGRFRNDYLASIYVKG